MSETPKKQTFLHGTALLTLATAIVKVIGALYKIPLKHIIGDAGFGYFSNAYEIYTVLLMISTAGLPVAMSRVVSQASAQGNYRQVKRIYFVSRTIFLLLGAVGSLLMILLCRPLANMRHQPDAWAAICALGPAVFLICMMSAYRGFFQGQSNMIPTSVSQVLEAVVKLIVGIGAALVLMKLTQSYAYAAAGAILGVTVSCLVSAVYLNRRFRQAYDALPKNSEGKVSSRKSIARRLLAIAIPITIGSAGLQLVNVWASDIYMSRLLANFSQTMLPNQAQQLADTQKGIHAMTQTIFNLPCAFITPITVSVIPAVAAQLEQRRRKAVRATEESATRVTGLLAAPCAVGLALLAEPVCALLGGYSEEKLALATRMLTILGVGVLFNSVVLLTNALMQAHGQVNLPVVHMFIGGALKLILIFILAGNPHIGIVAAPIGTLCCFVCIMILNLFAMRKTLRKPPRILYCLSRSVLAALIMGVFVYLTKAGLSRLLTGEGRMTTLLLCLIPVLVGVVVYVFAAVLLRAITREDCLLLPKGAKIANLLHL